MILKYFNKELETVLKDQNHVVHRFKISIKFIGRTGLLPEYVQENMKRVEDMTKKYNKHFFNVAVAYGGQQEIIDATNKILKKCMKGILKPADLNTEIMKKHLYTNGQPSPDLILRTGGEKRLSNFLPFQSAYSELIFTDKKWPEFSKKDFDDALNEFEVRQRRFGS